MSKVVCANCQFFCRNYRDSVAEHTFEISGAQRKLALSGNLDWQRNAESLACFKGIWDEGVGISGSSLADLVAKQSRRGRCYFFPYQPGLLLPAAEKLQQHQQSRSEELRKYRLTIYALIVSILALVAKILYDHSK